MLGFIILLAGLCALTGTLGLGDLFPMASSMQSIFLSLTAILGVFLVAACDAFETRPVPVRTDEDA
jgi:hypothetical protein